MPNQKTDEIFVVACARCGAVKAAHVLGASEATYADIGASVVGAMRQGGRVFSIEPGPVVLRRCEDGCARRVLVNQGGNREQS